MSIALRQHRAFDPAPKPGLRGADFANIGVGGMGDGHNNYAHSMAWFKGKIYLGTTRSNMCMLRFQAAFETLPLVVWPVECPESRDELYRLDFSAQIWCYDPPLASWEMVFKAPMVEDANGNPVPREIGYRSMDIFHAPSDPEPALYIAAWAPGRAPGGLILRTYDGRSFEMISEYGIIDPPISATRCLTAFKGRMFFSPTAKRGTGGGQQNSANLPVVFETPDPASGEWIPANEFGFGDPGNTAIFTMGVWGDELVAGTFNLEGFQIWTSACEGHPPYEWRKLVDKGGGRGPLNQIVCTMAAFKGALYIGGAIQGGGIDRVNGIGPAAAEVLRVNPDRSTDVIVGDPRPGVRARAGLTAGFGNFFNGYMWAMAVYDGWLYCGTYDWSINLRWAILNQSPPKVRALVESVGVEQIIAAEGGADLWRSADGDNWLPVTRKGFGNPYNWGIRNLVATPEGLIAGTANVFGPRVAVRTGDGWTYQDNPRGGLEVWFGTRDGGAAA